MKDTILSRAFRIADGRAAAVFSNPLRRRLVLLLAAHEQSVTEIAGVTGLDLKQLHYHITALLRLGLVTIARERPRAGRPVKIYRAIATAFFVPEQLVAAKSAAALSLEMRNYLDKMYDLSRAGVVYHLGENGEPRMRSVQNPRIKPVAAAEYWRVLQLSRPEALRLSKEIDDCLRACVRRSKGIAGAYLVHFAFTPTSGFPGKISYK